MADVPDSLSAITRATLSHYEAAANDYRAGTLDHDVSQNLATLYRHIARTPPWTLLDFGCGPGRDLRAIAAAGHEAVGLDGTEAFVRMARATGAEVLHQDFVALDLPAGRFDGVFANASLQHVPRAALPAVLARLHDALRHDGVLFASIPRGDDEDGWNGPRYSVFHSPQTWRRHLAHAGFTELEHYFRPPGLPYAQQRWFASAWRKQPRERQAVR